MPPTQQLRTLRIAPANTVTNHVATSIVSDTGSIAGVGSSLLWVQHGYINSSAEIIATPPNTVIGRAKGPFKRLKESGGTTVSSKGTLHNVTMDGTRDWLVRSSCMIFHSGLSIGSSPKALSQLNLDLISGRGNFYINSYNAQITEIPAGQSFYVDKSSLLAVEYDQNTAFEIVGNKPYTAATRNNKDTLGVSPVTSVLETSEIPKVDLPQQTVEPVTPTTTTTHETTPKTPTAPPTPHYYLYNNRWWITMSKISRGLVHRLTSIPSSLLGMFKRSSNKAAKAAKNAVTFSKQQHPDSSEATTIPKPSLFSRFKSLLGSYTNPNPFQTFVHIRGPTKVVVGQMHMPKVSTQPNDIEPYITEPELPEPITFVPQTHDYLKIAEVINGRVVFRSVPNFSTYNGVNGN